MSFLDLLKIEFMKVKRSKIVPLIFIAPLLVVFSGVAGLSNYFTPEHTNAWPAMFIQSALVYAYYLLPFSMIVVCVMIAGRETGNNGILKMLALPVSRCALSMVYNGIWDKCLPKSAAIWRNFLTSVICAGIFTVIYGTCLFRMGATETQITRLALGFLIGITIVSFIILRTLAFINRKRNQNSPNVQERKETSQSKTEWTKIYNAQNIVETEQLVEMLKQSEIEAFSQEAGANVAMHGAPGFGIYGVNIFVKTDDAEKAVQLIKEINNQENEEIF